MKKVILGGALALGLVFTSCGSEIEKYGDEICACFDSAEKQEDATKCIDEVREKYKSLKDLGEETATEEQKKEMEAVFKKTSKCAEEATKKFEKASE